METIEFDQECPSCKGTGLYVGMAERDGVAVVCSKCDGTGCFHFVHQYKPFKERHSREGINWVIEHNPGICVGLDKKYEYPNFGGMTYDEWKNKGKFPPKSEMRQFVCPAWWYQAVDYKKKPQWDECPISGSFKDCRYFMTKELCWDKWDDEWLSPKQQGDIAQMAEASDLKSA